MATITPEQNKQYQLHPELDALLKRLRRRIRWYVAVEGGAILLAVVAGLFWILLAFDSSYFALTRLDVPIPLRVILVCAAIGVIAAVGLAFLLFRLLRRMRRRALALVLEKRFPELDDRLILAVERAEGLLDAPQGSLGGVMLDRAAGDVAQVVETLELRDVFSRRPLRRAILLAVLLWAPIIALGVLRPEVLAVWRDGYIRFAETYHIRDTHLALTIIAPPDNRRREIPAGGTYKHPRGAPLVMLLTVPESPRADGAEWAVPESVYAYRETESGGTQTIPAAGASSRQFRIAIEDVTESMELWVTGGDYTTSVPYTIEVVDPPRVERVKLSNYYPAYTRLNNRNAQGDLLPEEVTLSGPVATVPTGTWMAFTAETNKPIVNAHLFLGRAELTFGRFSPGPDEPGQWRAVLTLKDEEGGGGGKKIPLPSSLAREFIASDGRAITVPLLVGGESVSFLPEGPENRPGLPADRPVFAIGARTPIRITFEDADHVVSLEPSTFEIRGTADTPPEVRVQLQGVSNIITRRAVVPLEGTITDDYGIARARFEYRVDDAEKWSSRPFANPPSGFPRELTLQRDPERAVEWLDTATLDLEVGQELTLRIAAVDGDTLTGPHTARSDEYQFTIVTAEELLATLYNQEINLRKRFEQSLTEMKAVRLDLVAQRKRLGREAGSAQEEAEADDSLRSAADRAFAETQQHAGQVRSVAESFSGLVQQFVNNRVHTENQLERIRQGILEPLHQLVEEGFPRLDRAIGQLRLRIAEQENPAPGLDASIAAAESLIATMESALAEMRDLAEFHEAIQELTQIIEAEQKLRDQTEQRQKESVIEGLGELLE